MLYDPAAFEPLTDEPWDEARVRDGIAAIVADADAAFDPDALWPAHEWDGWQAPLPMKNLYVGAAGVVCALDDLRRRGLAETTLDLPAVALRALELWRAEPDYMAGRSRPRAGRVGLLTGEAGILLVACRLGHPLEDDLRDRIRANLANEAEDLMWGTPGTLVAAVAMGWDDLARESADALAARRDADGLWTQRLWGTSFRGIGTVHGLAGNVRALLQVDDPRNEALRAESAAALARAATREDGLANWSSEGKLQWCAGAPGVVSAARDYLDEELAARRRRARLASRRAGRREGARDLPRHLGQRLRAARRVRADAGRAVARSRAPLRGARSGAGRAHARPLLALHRRRRNRALRRRLPRGRRALPGARAQPSSGLKRTTYDRPMDERLERYAELVVRVGANVQPGQEVFLLPKVEHHELARALARQAYKAGASYVHVRYQDAHVCKAMIELGPDEALTYSPEWLKAFVSSMSGNAMIATTGDPEPELLADLDGERVGRAVPHEVVQIRMQQIGENTVNWCGVGAPSEGWATAGLRRARRRAAVGEGRVLHAPRRARSRRRLARAPRAARGAGRGAERPQARTRSATAAPAPTSRSGCSRTRAGLGGGSDTTTGIAYVANMPTEEVFTSPDAGRTEGTIRSTHAARRSPGQIVRGLELTFEDGPGRQRRGRDRRGARPQPLRDDRERRPARRGRARHEASRASARPGRSSTTRSSTRTRPATSRTARASPSSSTASPTTA